LGGPIKWDLPGPKKWDWTDWRYKEKNHESIARYEEQVKVAKKSNRAKPSKISGKACGEKNIFFNGATGSGYPQGKVPLSQRVRIQIKYLNRCEWIYSKSRELQQQHPRLKVARASTEGLGAEHGSIARSSKYRSWVSPERHNWWSNPTSNTNMYSNKWKKEESQCRKILVQEGSETTISDRGSDWAPQTRSSTQQVSLYWFCGRQDQRQSCKFSMEFNKTKYSDLKDQKKNQKVIYEINLQD
jgi:hypothetical protein